MKEASDQDPDRVVRYALSWPEWLAGRVAKAANAKAMPMAVWLREAAMEKLKRQEREQQR